MKSWSLLASCRSALLILSALLVASPQILPAGEMSQGLISCTPAVQPAVCEFSHTEFSMIQQMSVFLHNVQFVLADSEAFNAEKSRAGDYVAAHVVNKTNPGSIVPMLHSSFDDHIIFEVSAESLTQCPDRVVMSADIFKPSDTVKPAAKTTRGAGQRIDLELGGEYVRFIHGYLEGCYNARFSLPR